MHADTTAPRAPQEASPHSEEEIRAIIRRQAGALARPAPLPSANPSAAFVRDLGYDSLRVLEFVQNVEEIFQLPPIPERTLMTIVTVTHAEETVLKLLAARASSALEHG